MNDLIAHLLYCMFYSFLELKRLEDKNGEKSTDDANNNEGINPLVQPYLMFGDWVRGGEWDGLIGVVFVG